MKPNYIAKKSIISVLSFWLILFSWLVIPLVIQISRIVKAKCYTIEFYDSKIIVKSGFFNKQERQIAFAGVHSVSISQTLCGRIFKYGNITVDCPGKWDIDSSCIKNPKALKNYLEGQLTSGGLTGIIN